MKWVEYKCVFCNTIFRVRFESPYQKDPKMCPYCASLTLERVREISEEGD